jgi:hypothetical protein
MVEQRRDRPENIQPAHRSNAVRQCGRPQKACIILSQHNLEFNGRGAGEEYSAVDIAISDGILGRLA